jgi:dihydroxy-acid dehydratase
MSDGAIHPGKDPKTGEALDIVSAYQVAGHPDADYRHHIACHACPGIGSCGGMFTYNTMQTFIGVVGMQPMHMVAPPSDDPRRTNEFAGELVDHLANLMEKDLKPRDIVVRDSIRNAVIVRHGDRRLDQRHPARSGDRARRGLRRLLEGHHHAGGVQLPLAAYRPVLTDARPYGKYSMVDIDEVGGVQVIVRELLDAGLLNGDVLTCTGETLGKQVERLGAKKADGRSSMPSRSRTSRPAACACWAATCRRTSRRSSSSPASRAGSRTTCSAAGRASSRASRALLDALDRHPERFQNHDMVIVRYEGPSGAPGMPEMLDPTSRITTLCRERNIIVGLMTDARFSGGSVGLVIGHVGPEAALGGRSPSSRTATRSSSTSTERADLHRADRCRDPGQAQGGLGEGSSPAMAASIPTAAQPTPACSTVRAPPPCRRPRGGGLHPNREVWVREPRRADRSGFVLRNRHRPQASKAF